MINQNELVSHIKKVATECGYKIDFTNVDKIIEECIVVKQHPFEALEVLLENLVGYDYESFLDVVEDCCNYTLGKKDINRNVEDVLFDITKKEFDYYLYKSSIFNNYVLIDYDALSVVIAG